jgi:hypothetical protein
MFPSPEKFKQKLKVARINVETIYPELPKHLCESISQMSELIVPLIEARPQQTQIVILGGSRPISRTFLKGMAAHLPAGEAQHLCANPLELTAAENSRFYRDTQNPYIPPSLNDFLLQHPTGQLIFIDDQAVFHQKSRWVLDKMAKLYPGVSCHYAVFVSCTLPTQDTHPNSHTAYIEYPFYDFIHGLSEMISDYDYLVSEKSMPPEPEVEFLLQKLSAMILNCG